MFFVRVLTGFIAVLFTLTTSTLALRCYVCDSTSEVGYFDAEKDCNTESSLRQCPDNKHKACMIEAFRHEESSYHIVKRCLIDCPVAINGSAEHTRCCVRDECNEVISIDVYSDSRTHAKSSTINGMSEDTTDLREDFPSSRRLDLSMEQRSGPSPPALSAEPTNREPTREPPSSKLGGPTLPSSQEPALQPPRVSSRPPLVPSDNFIVGGRPIGDPSHAPGAPAGGLTHHNYGGRGGQPPLLMMTTHTASPTLVAPGTSRHGDGVGGGGSGGASLRSRTSGQSVSGAAGSHAKGDYMSATWLAFCSTVGALVTSFMHGGSRRVL